MSVSAIRSRIKTNLEAVTGCGEVHDYDRWASHWNDFLSLFKDDNGLINGWTISLIKMQNAMESFTQMGRAHVFRLQKVYGLNDGDATGKTFEGHLEAVVNAFKADDTLNGACLTCTPPWGPMEGLTGLQIDKIEHRLFGTVLCHYADCRLGPVELVTD